MEWPDNRSGTIRSSSTGVPASRPRASSCSAAMASTSIWCCCAAGWRAVASSSTPWRCARRAAVASWQAEVVRLLRALRQRLKARLADPEPRSVVERWPGLAAAIREALALEIDGERLAQLGLRQAVDGLPRARRLRWRWRASISAAMAIRRPRSACPAQPAGRCLSRCRDERCGGEPRLARDERHRPWAGAVRVGNRGRPL